LSYMTLSDGTLFYIEHLPSMILSYWTFSDYSLFYLKHLTCTILSQGTLSEETMSFLQHITHRILSFMTLFDGTSYFVRMSYVQPTYSIWPTGFCPKRTLCDSTWSNLHHLTQAILSGCTFSDSTLSKIV
jgi:hypothetical protein